MEHRLGGFHSSCSQSTFHCKGFSWLYVVQEAWGSVKSNRLVPHSMPFQQPGVYNRPRVAKFTQRQRVLVEKNVLNRVMKVFRGLEEVIEILGGERRWGWASESVARDAARQEGRGINRIHFFGLNTRSIDISWCISGPGGWVREGCRWNSIL